MSDGTISGDRLRSYIERIERLNSEKAELAADIRDIFAEAKSAGFDPKVMRQVIKLRRMERSDRAEQEEMVQLYMSAIGMV